MYNIDIPSNLEKDYNLFLDILNGSTNEVLLKSYFPAIKSDTAKKYKKRKDGIGNYIADDKLFDYMRIINFHIQRKIDLERKRAKTFLYDDNESEKAGFIDEAKYIKLGKKIPKQSANQIEEWAKKAYPNIDTDLWEYEFNHSILKSFR